MIPSLFPLAIKNLKNRKLRSGLTMLGIIIAIATIFILLSVSLGLKAAVEEQFRLLGTDKFFIHLKGQLGGPGSTGAVHLTTEDAEIVEKVSGVQDISYMVFANAEIKVKSERRYVPVIGLSLDKNKVFEELENYKAEEGRLLRKGDRGVVSIGSQYKHNALFDKSLGTNDNLFINGREFKVQSIIISQGNPGDDRLIYIPLDDFNELFNNTDRIDQIIVQVHNSAELKEVAERVEKKLRATRHVTEKTQDFTILTPEELLGTFGTILTILTAFLASIAAIALLVGGIGIATTMYTSVLERTREIGVMKAVGARNSDIVQLFLIEAGLLGLIGGILGVLFGFLVGYIIEYIAVNQLGTTLLQVETPVWLVISCLVFAFLVGAISGIWPAWHASRIKTVDALRYE